MFSIRNCSKICRIKQFFKVQIYRNVNNSTIADQSLIRNIGILAHIDAGKTTTTERMLYYSGRISSMGEVHRGNTVTDFLEQERSRGITICSAFVAFKWQDHLINLVDTPGHIDFTMEVEQALGVIDSAIIILDATAGVEAQTITVWKQAKSQKLPCLVYINKMDREAGNLNLCMNSLQTKLSCKPLLLHYPIFAGNKFEGVVDLPSFKKMVWLENRKTYHCQNVEKSDKFYQEAYESRLCLVDDLSSLDDRLADLVIEYDSLEKISTEDIVESVRKITLNQKGVPVICGSSYKNIGIETLLDSVIKYLPSPVHSSISSMFTKLKKETLAKCFKIVHDKQRGAITFFRIYSGDIFKSQKVFNTRKLKSDTVGKILIPFADDFKEVPSVTAGNFIAVTGMKDTLTGDMICGSQNEIKIIKEKLTKLFSLTEEEINKLVNLNQVIPDPVFFCSVEPSSQAYQKQLDKALTELQKEDPSLRVSSDEETGQTVLAGMGELHLEVIKDRIKTNYNIDVDLGSVQIVYKEKLCSSHKCSHTLKNSVGSHDQSVTLTISLKPGFSHELLHLDMSGESAPNLAHLSPKIFSTIKRGITSSLKKGPLFSSQVVDVHAVLHWYEAHRHTPEHLVAAAASQCVEKILKLVETKLLEPVMLLTITVPKEFSNIVTMDINRRRGTLLDVSMKGGIVEILSHTPLSQLIGYAKQLRTMTSGTANLSISFSTYQEMSNEQLQSLQNGSSL